MNRSPKFALQTFTVRKDLKDTKDYDGMMARIKAMGLNAVELARINFTEKEIFAFKNTAKNYAIDIRSTQITFDYLQKNRDWVVDFHQQLECPLVAVSVLPIKAILGGEKHLLKFAEELNALGRFYHERGLQLLFHHHDFEFKHYGDRIGLDLILENTDADYVGIEMDTYWVQRGGKSPQDLIADLHGRVKVVHLRDFRIRWKWFDLLPMDAELGAGNLDFKRIVDSCVANGVQSMAIEQDSNQPYASVEQSVNHLKSLGFDHLF